MLLKYCLVILKFVIGLTLGLFIIEIFLISINYPYQGCFKVDEAPENNFVEFDEELGWRYIPNISKPMWPEDMYPGVEIFINKEGYRAISTDYKTDFSKPIILFVGDSITFGHGLNYEDTFVYKIKKLFDNKFETINFGVQGYATDQSYILLNKIISKYKPVAVVYLYAWDQMARNANYDRRDFFRCSKFVATKPKFEEFNGELIQTEKPKKYENYTSIKTVLFLNNFIHRNYRNQQIDKDISLTKVLILNIKNLIFNSSAIPIFMLFEPVPKNVEDIIFEKEKLDYIDLGAFLTSENPSLILNKHDIHPNSQANTTIANVFYNKYGKLLNERLYQ